MDIEAITPKPQGDVTLRAQVRECIDLFAPHLILGISDELSSIGNIVRVRLVRDMVDEYNRNL